MFYILIVSILILSSYTIIQILLEGNKTLSRKYLISIIVILAISLIPSYLIGVLNEKWGLIIERLPTRHWVLLIGPGLYFYGKACMYQKNKLKDLLHLLPALIWWIIFQFTIGLKIELENFPQVYGFTSIISLESYSFILLYKLSNYSKMLKNQYSYEDIYMEIKWLSYISKVLIVITTIVCIGVNLFHHFSPRVSSQINIFRGDPEFINMIHAISVITFLFVFTLLAQKQERQKPKTLQEPQMLKEQQKPKPIKNNTYPNYNILSIAHECGFNSKATFNNAIKRKFNKTPSQLIKEIGSTL